VEVAPNSTPPVCKIIDYGKFKYEQEKMAKDAKKKQSIVLLKEVRFRPNIEEHDYQVKLKNACRFLEHGDKVKVSILFRGREMNLMEKGRKLLARVAKDVELYGKIDHLPSKEGRILIMTLISLRKGKK
jgi:translation initiation factor IF-3